MDPRESRLNGEKTESGRDAGGRFASGNPGGPGRPRRETERAYLAAMADAVPPDTWRVIVEAAAASAFQGDRHAREWLSAYLMGMPEGRAITLHALAVQEMSGTDPVAAEAEIDSLLSGL
jgi:hypothetical protein